MGAALGARTSLMGPVLDQWQQVQPPRVYDAGQTQDRRKEQGRHNPKKPSDPSTD